MKQAVNDYGRHLNDLVRQLTLHSTDHHQQTLL